MPPAHSMPPLYCFFWFSHLPKCSDNPALVGGPCFIALHFTLPVLHSISSWRNEEFEQRNGWKAIKGDAGLLLLAKVCSTKEKTPGRMFRSCFVAKYLELFSHCSCSALTWPWLFVTGVVLLESTYYTFPKWRTQSLFQRTTSTNYLCI